ncbi:MAG: two-component system sensor protein [Myxococcales bacterium]|nr:two-component system sensor protein [Myxococcales bacterium]
MDLRTRTSLFCGALALAIAVSILLRGRRRRAHVFFAAFAADIGLWYITQWLYHFVRSEVWVRFTAILAVLLPQFAVHLFEVLVPRRDQRSTLVRVSGVLMVPMMVLVLSPEHKHGLVRGAVMLYVFGLIAAGLWSLALRGERSRSRATQQRVRFLVVVGALAAAFTLADFLWFVGAPLPPVGAVLSIVFLFILSESMIRERLVDLYDILGRLLVSTALAFTLAGIFYVFVVLVGGFSTMYLNAILAAIVILVLFDPLRDKVEQYIHFAFFRERVDLDRAVAKARQQLAHVLEPREMMQVALSALEASRRATAAALYLRDPTGPDFELGQAFGPLPPSRIDSATARPLLDRLAASPSVSLELIRHDVLERRRSGQGPALEADERLLAAAEVLGPYKTGVCLGVRGEGQALVAILLVVDDRVSDAFSSEDVALLETLCVQMAVVIENSQQYRRMQERDRLAALGQMAAGLAHEVKNPLGAIKGAAQLLNEPEDGANADPHAREFLGIILEEVDRLDRVVGSVLDYARPSKGNPGAVDVNAVVRRTLQVLSSGQKSEQEVATDLTEDLPLVRADAEQLRQVLMNLVQNALQATAAKGGAVSVSTRMRAGGHGKTDSVEIAVRDHGTGITPQVLKSLFVPFFTTKEKGTGLGLAISQRLVEEWGGRIEVVSQAGSGSTFSVVLPAGIELVPTPQPSAAAGGEGPPGAGTPEAEPA